jgi:hypothetical protein
MSFSGGSTERISSSSASNCAGPSSTGVTNRRRDVSVASSFASGQHRSGRCRVRVGPRLDDGRLFLEREARALEVDVGDVEDLEPG